MSQNLSATPSSSRTVSDSNRNNLAPAHVVRTTSNNNRNRNNTNSSSNSKNSDNNNDNPLVDQPSPDTPNTPAEILVVQVRDVIVSEVPTPPQDLISSTSAVHYGAVVSSTLTDLVHQHYISVDEYVATAYFDAWRFTAIVAQRMIVS